MKEEATLAKRLDKIVPAIIEAVDLPLGFTMARTLDLASCNGAPQSEDLERLLRDIARLTDRAPILNKEGLDRTERAWHPSRAALIGRAAISAGIALLAIAANVVGSNESTAYPNPETGVYGHIAQRRGPLDRIK